MNESNECFVRIPKSRVTGPAVAASVVLCGLFSGALYFETRSIEAALCFFLVVNVYVLIRVRRDSGGWWMKLSGDTISWYSGWKERSLRIEDIQSINSFGDATLKSGKLVRMPLPDNDFLEFYLLLYCKQPSLFSERPSKMNPRT